MTYDPRLRSVKEVDRALRCCQERLEYWAEVHAWGAELARQSTRRDIEYLQRVRESLIRDERKYLK